MVAGAWDKGSVSNHDVLNQDSEHILSERGGSLLMGRIASDQMLLLDLYQWVLLDRHGQKVAAKSDI